MKRNKLIIFALTAILLGSCSEKLDEYLVNPNTPSVDAADANLYLNAAQLSYAGFFDGAQNFGEQVTRSEMTDVTPAKLGCKNRRRRRILNGSGGSPIRATSGHGLNRPLRIPAIFFMTFGVDAFD